MFIPSPGFCFVLFKKIPINVKDILLHTAGIAACVDHNTLVSESDSYFTFRSVSQTVTWLVSQSSKHSACQKAF